MNGKRMKKEFKRMKKEFKRMNIKK